MPVDDRARVERRPGCGITGEQPVNSLGSSPDVRRDVAANVDESSEQIRVHHSKIDRTGPAGGKAHDAPLRLLSRSERRVDLRNDISGQMISRVTARSVDTLGIDGESACGIGKDGHRRITAVCCGARPLFCMA